MNREERRKAGVKKNKDPVYLLKQSQVKNQVDNIIKYDAEVQRVLREESRRVHLEEGRKNIVDTDTVILMTLHQIFGFGKKRLMQFAKGLVELHKYYNSRYSEDNIYAMKVYLRDRVGIDVDSLQEELANAIKESPDEG